MRSEQYHRKLIQHYHEPGQVHELTFSCFRHMPLLTNDEWRRELTDSINRGLEAWHFALLAFVYMPNHIHMLVLPQNTNAELDRLLYAIKRPFSYRIKRRLQESNSPLLNRLTVRERPGKQSFRFWQEGPGYDRNTFGDAAIIASMDYNHNNPVRKGLVSGPEFWKWSSWKVYHDTDYLADVDLPKVVRFTG